MQKCWWPSIRFYEITDACQIGMYIDHRFHMCRVFGRLNAWYVFSLGMHATRFVQPKSLIVTTQQNLWSKF